MGSVEFHGSAIFCPRQCGPDGALPAVVQRRSVPIGHGGRKGFLCLPLTFQRVKTGPLPYNVEYQLQALKCKPRPLTDEERDLVADLKSMDDVMSRPTPDAQKELLDRVRGAANEADDELLDEEFNVG